MANKRIRNYDDGSANVTATDSIGVDRAGLDELERVTLQQAVDATDVAGAYVPGGTDVPVADGGTGASTAAGARTNLGLVIGADVQAHSAILAATTASFTTADETKLDGIEASADVTDTANVTAAGAVMDSEVSSLSGVKTLTVPDNTTVSTFGATLVDDVDAATARTTLGVDAAGTDNSTDVTLAGSPDYITISGQTITRGLVDLAADVTGDLPVAEGGTGASTAQAAAANLRVAPATVTGTADTLAAGDDATTILYTAAGAVTVTLANIATGFEAVLVSLGAGGLSVAAGGMSFANSFTPNLTVAQGEALFVKQTAASTWIVLGGTAA